MKKRAPGTLRSFSSRYLLVLLPLLLGFPGALLAYAQQPPEPVDASPIDGQAYFVINQQSGMQMDLDNGSTTTGGSILQQNRSFTSLSQRWALTALPSGYWVISNLANGLCLDSVTASGTTGTVQNPCVPATLTQQWSFTATTNGYATILNHGTGLALDVSGSSLSAGAQLNQSPVAAPPTQSQQWLLRPVFFRGVDNALLEKQEAERVSGGIPWWQDAGQTGDVLQILKNHGVNMVRVRPTSAPPYETYTSTTCSGNGCYAETDAADLDLAKRAKQLGMSLELTLLFDGGSSSAIPGAWSSDTLAQAEADVYNYVKSEVEAYREAGAMPDMVTIGNEVDTGFLGSLGSPSGSNFAPFAALQKQGMQAILDASSDPAIGSPLPPPIRCIHITPAWDLTNFFGYVSSNAIPYDAICQSYYPLFHGPLTAAQAEQTNPNSQPVEETVLTNAANTLGKPIFIIETGEHYEDGFDANDPWYLTTPAGQRQFLIDLNNVLKGLPNNLGMGFEYWDPAGVDLPKAGGGYANGDGTTDAIFQWNGLTLFDNADTSGSSQSTDPDYSAVLPGLDALGGTLDPTLAYKLVNVATGQVLETAGTPTASGIPLDTAADTGSATLSQQWTITSNGDGYFQIANRNVASGEPAEALDNGGAESAGAAVSANAAASGAASQEWNIVTTGAGNHAIVNKASGLVLAASGVIEQQAPSATNQDWITPASKEQQWRIIPARITSASVPAKLGFASGTPGNITSGSAIGSVNVDVEDSSGSLVLSPAETVALNISGPSGFSQALTAASANGVASFDLSGVSFTSAGTYTLTASAAGLASAMATLTVIAATAPNFSIAASPTSLTISSGGSGNVALTLTPVGGYTGTVTMSCNTKLSGVSCSFNPATYTADGSDTALTGTMTVAASSTAAMLRQPFTKKRSGLLAALAFFFPGSSLLFLAGFRRRRLLQGRRGARMMILAALLLFGSMGLTACGGGGGNQGGGGTPPPVSGTVTVIASGSTGSVSQSINLTVNVQQ
ncbi:MAG: glycosyl hydrolase 53 family protein [Acidobacteriaceae bacterium]